MQSAGAVSLWGRQGRVGAWIMTEFWDSVTVGVTREWVQEWRRLEGQCYCACDKGVGAGVVTTKGTVLQWTTQGSGCRSGDD